jgi:hypothetical protein
MTDKLTITGSADLLATVPHLLGAHPEESFVVLTARAGLLGATLRVDAPAESAPLDYAQMMATYAAADEAATASYLIIYTDETGADGQFPYAAHVAALGNELATARMPVQKVWLVTSTHWAAYGTTETNPLDEITDSNANATLTYFGSATDIDLYNPALLGNRAAPVQAPEGTEEDLAQAREDWAATLNTSGMPNTETARKLAAAFQHKFIRDFLMGDTITRNSGAFQDIMLGKFDGRPDWARVDHAQAIAFELMKAVPEGQRAPMLTLMGWLEWLKGHGTQADRYLKLATEDVPGFRLAALMRELLSRLSVAEVAKDPETAYQRPRS